MKFFDAGENAVAIIAVGVSPTGVIAIGALPLGFFALGQGARGVFVLGQLAIGLVSVGQVSLGILYSIGQLSFGARGFGQLFLPLFPKITKIQKEKIDGIAKPLKKFDYLIHYANSILTPLGAMQLLLWAGAWLVFWKAVCEPFILTFVNNKVVF